MQLCIQWNRTVRQISKWAFSAMSHPGEIKRLQIERKKIIESVEHSRRNERPVYAICESSGTVLAAGLAAFPALSRAS